MLIELALAAVLHTSPTPPSGDGGPQVTVTHTCTDGAKGRVCHTSTRTVTRTGGPVKAAKGAAAKPPVDTVGNTRKASVVSVVPVTMLTGTMLVHLHAMGYDAVGGSISVPTVLLTEVLRMP